MSTSSAARPATAQKASTNDVKDKALKHQFLVIEVSTVEDRRYPHTLFGCETLEEALKICKQMNTDAGFQKFAVRGSRTDQQ
jgi:hypothetical protein